MTHPLAGVLEQIAINRRNNDDTTVWRNESPDAAPVLLARIPAGEMLLGATQHPEG